MRIAAVVMNMMVIRITAHCDIVVVAAPSSVKAIADIVILAVVDRFIVTAAATVAVVHHEGDAGKALPFGGGVFHRSIYIGFVLFRDNE